MSVFSVGVHTLLSPSFTLELPVFMVPSHVPFAPSSSWAVPSPVMFPFRTELLPFICSTAVDGLSTVTVPSISVLFPLFRYILPPFFASMSPSLYVPPVRLTAPLSAMIFPLWTVLFLMLMCPSFSALMTVPPLMVTLLAVISAFFPEAVMLPPKVPPS